MRGMPQTPGRPPVLGARPEDAGGDLAPYRPEPQHQPLGPVGHPGRAHKQIRREGQAGPRPCAPVTRQDDGPVGTERRSPSQHAGEMPAHQVGHKAAQIELERPGHGGTVLGGHVRQVEGHIEPCHRERPAPVTGQPTLRGLLDHPPGHRVQACLPQTRHVLGREEPALGSRAHRQTLRTAHSSACVPGSGLGCDITTPQSRKGGKAGRIRTDVLQLEARARRPLRYSLAVRDHSAGSLEIACLYAKSSTAQPCRGTLFQGKE